MAKWVRNPGAEFSKTFPIVMGGACTMVTKRLDFRAIRIVDLNETIVRQGLVDHADSMGVAALGRGRTMVNGRRWHQSCGNVSFAQAGGPNTLNLADRLNFRKQTS